MWNPPLEAIRPSGWPGPGGKYTGFTETERSATAAARSASATARRASPSSLGMIRKLTGAWWLSRPEVSAPARWARSARSASTWYWSAQRSSSASS